MRSRLYPLVYGARVWTASMTEMTDRLEAHLRRLREAQMRRLLAHTLETSRLWQEQLELPLADGDQAGIDPAQSLEIKVELSERDERRIARRVRRIFELRTKATGMAHLKVEERKIIEPRLAGVRLAGPQTEHQADEVASALLDEMPWLREAVAHVWRGARRSAAEGLGLGFSPVLLEGAPASGKTHFARRVAAFAGVPLVEIDLGVGSESFRIGGLSRGWGSAVPGRPIEEILSSGVGNIVVAVDELDKAGVARGSDGYRTSALHALLGLLEPGSAARWECPFFRMKFDLGRICWILCANDISHLPAPLLSRTKVIRVPPPSIGDVAGVAFREGARRGIDPESLEVLAHTIVRARGAITLRHLARALDELQAVQQRGPLH